MSLIEGGLLGDIPHTGSSHVGESSSDSEVLKLFLGLQRICRRKRIESFG